MKKIAALSLGLLMSIIAFGQQEEKIEGYLIQGNITGDYTGKVYLTKEDGIHGKQTDIDSCEVIDGKYTFKGPNVDVVTMHFIKSKDGQLTPLFLENGRIRIAGKADNFLWAKVRGTTNNDIFNLCRTMEQYIKDSLMITIDIDWNKYGRDPKKEETEFYRRTDLINNRRLDIQRYLVKKFNDEPFAPFMIMFEMVADVSTDELQELRAQLSPSLANHPYTKSLEEYIESQGFQVGVDAYQFKLQGIDGNQIALKEYAGKYVFLDFWASWCGPCRREIPNVIKMYKALKGKNFEIIGISLDTDEAAWKKSVKELNMSWPQASDLDGWNSKVVRRYNVQGIPRTVLINPEGKVIAIDLRGEDLTAKVKELIKKK